MVSSRWRAVRAAIVLCVALATAGCVTAAPECSSPISAGTVSASGLSSAQTVLLSDNGNDLSVAGSQFTIKHGARAYLGQCTSGWQPNSVTRIPLLGRSISATINLSSVSCACNLAMYLVAMPGIGTNGQPDKSTSGDYYCDANEVSGVWCPEIDLMEANNNALQVTPHKCDTPWGNGYYPSCDRGGCALNTYKMDSTSFGPGGQFKINTQQPFSINTTFTADGSGQTLQTMTTVLSQNGQEFTITHSDSDCGGGYLESLSTVLKQGMAVVFSSWGNSAGTMSWLDEPPCPPSESCNVGADVATISNVAVQ